LRRLSLWEVTPSAEDVLEADGCSGRMGVTWSKKSEILRFPFVAVEVYGKMSLEKFCGYSFRKLVTFSRFPSCC
jgi:hypothetical protein